MNDKKSKRTVVTPPPALPGITRRTTLKFLGVTITNGLSIAEHIQGVITSCSQTLHALRVLRAHGMPPSALHEVFRAVVITKLCYASSAWWGFSAAGRGGATVLKVGGAILRAERAKKFFDPQLFGQQWGDKILLR